MCARIYQIKSLDDLTNETLIELLNRFERDTGEHPKRAVVSPVFEEHGIPKLANLRLGGVWVKEAIENLANDARAGSQVCGVAYVVDPNQTVLYQING